MTDVIDAGREGVAPSREPLLCSVAEAARLLGISKTLMYSLIQRGEVLVVRLGADMRIARSDIEALAASGLRRSM